MARGSSSALQVCFDTTEWEMFRHAATFSSHTDIEDYTDTVTSYITKCTDDMTHTKAIITHTAWASFCHQQAINQCLYPLCKGQCVYCLNFFCLFIFFPPLLDIFPEKIIEATNKIGVA